MPHWHLRLELTSVVSQDPSICHLQDISVCAETLTSSQQAKGWEALCGALRHVVQVSETLSHT